MAYIPKGVSFRHRVVRKPARNGWAFSLALPPEYTEPGKPAAAKPAPGKTSANLEDKLILRQVKQKWPTINPLASDFVAGSRDFLKDVKGARPNFALYYIMRAGMFPETPHSHHCDEYLMFLPADPHNMKGLGAVVEVAYGEEWKKIAFANSALVFFPKELQHCPIHVKKMDRPFLFGHFWPMGEESHILPAK
jgi:hypothetical protein